jgi:predicted TPR repeat methyltransferase
MNCCQCQGIEDLFNEKMVSQELKQYQTKGPSKTTCMMVEALKDAGVQARTLLDIGGGVGAVQHELIAAGVNQATDVDASQAYLRAAREEANRRGIADRIHFAHGNFVDLASQISPADIVTLDRVICCYPDMEQLVGLSAARANRLYGLVYPRDTWLARVGVRVLNFTFWLQRKPFRTFVHSSQAVDAIVRGQGLKPQFHRHTWLWQVVVYGS